MAESGTTIATPALVKVTTAATRVQIPTSGASYGAKSVIIQALSTNAEPVVVGDANVVAATGTQAAPLQRGIELKPSATLSIDLCDATQIWVDSRTAKDGVSYMLLFA